MSDAVKSFFAAWAEQDEAARNAAIADAFGTATPYYADPRTQAPLTSVAAIQGYVAEFSKMAPGMPVEVTHLSTTLHFARAAVRFGSGDQAQHGQYIVDLDDAGKMTRLVGFVGMGAPA